MDQRLLALVQMFRWHRNEDDVRDEHVLRHVARLMGAASSRRPHLATWDRGDAEDTIHRERAVLRQEPARGQVSDAIIVHRVRRGNFPAPRHVHARNR